MSISKWIASPNVELRNTRLELYVFRSRLTIALAFVFVMFLLLFARFFYLQVVKHEYYATLAETNRIGLAPIAPNRGSILDRNGVVLAQDVPGYALEIRPDKLVADVDVLIDELAAVIEISPGNRRRFKRLLEESHGFESVPIRTQLSDEEVARFAANRYRFPAIELNARLFRQYPQGEIFSHVVGHIGRINQRELGEFEREGQSAHYRGTTSIGKTGLENRYEKYLHGNPGVEEVEVDAAGRAVRTLSRQQPVSGSNLVLTLDAKLQEVAYRALNGRRGALVALEPATGGVLAFVSTPGFDPNLFVDGIDPQSWKALNDSPDRPMVNRALSGTYPPGSTFKPFMALAGLTFGRLQPERSILDAGYFVLGGRQFRDQKVGGHGMVNMFMSIVESCNTYYYMLANELGIDNIASFMARFGFGSRTGIDLNGESKGTLPSQSWKMQRFRQKWYSGETINVGIGQGYNAYTPLQLAQAIAVIANDGQTYRPRVVDYIENAATAERIMIEPQPLPSLDLDPEHLKVIQRALSGVSREGTAARAFTDAQYTSAGKTGTAQIAINSGQKDIESGVPERQRDHSLYVAYAPVDNPRIALAVIVENAGFGARAAAPIARQVFDYYLLGT